MAVVHMINEMTSSCKQCMYLLQLLVLNGLQRKRWLSAKFISTKDNFLSDALSRGQMSHFRRLGQDMNNKGDSVCEAIWPIEKVWQ